MSDTIQNSVPSVPSVTSCSKSGSPNHILATANHIDLLRLGLIVRKLESARSELSILPATAIPIAARLNAMNLIEQTLIIITPSQSETIEA